nr:MAG TPA: hypothetical protein [Caudoviricetes sp.]
MCKRREWEKNVKPSLHTTNNVCIKLRFFISFKVEIVICTIFTGVKRIFESCIMIEKFFQVHISTEDKICPA